ncbi:MAG: 2-oxoglutarate dehydrogenase complex dihydrolipoyllysine-residue succinyltransferase [Thermomicrobiales bacterium]|nr:MAG: 2-oxoglutarate dehydrogenase complex dihydrolipoyllysine-residue succinyltransferase [Thermomicrobiales bacterium]
MPVEIRVPALGESLVDAVVGQWLKSEGDAVTRGETILELETDKVNLDVTADEDGVLSSIAHREGDVVTVGEVLGTIAAGAVAGNGASIPAVEQAPAPAPEPVAAAAAPTPVPAPVEAAPAGDGSGRAAPAVRRLAEEHNIDLNEVPGTGPGGRVTREDILSRAAARQAPAAAPVALTPVASAPGPGAAKPAAPAVPRVEDARGEERIRMNRRRQTIANRLVEAQQTAAMLTTFNEIDMSAVMALRAERKDAFKEKFGVNLGFMSFFTKASVGALKAFPYVNAEIQGDEIVLKKYYDIGVAVGIEEGLVVPVVRDADRKSFADIEKTIVDLATRARSGDLELSELLGGTFTITNGGIYGSLMSTPILNTPQVGILGMHAIQKRAVVVDDEIVIRPMMYVALSYDHRIVDGSTAVRFLVKVKELIEDPTSLLLEG